MLSANLPLVSRLRMSGAILPFSLSSWRAHGKFQLGANAVILPPSTARLLPNTYFSNHSFITNHPNVPRHIIFFFFISPASSYLTTVGVKCYCCMWSHTVRHTTLSSTPLDKWSARPKGNTHKHPCPRREFFLLFSWALYFIRTCIFVLIVLHFAFCL